LVKKNHNNQDPLVSVIINCYNGEKYLHEAIDSIYEQTYPNWEIIFWDNASTDNSLKIAKSYDSRLLWFESDKTVLLGEARNKAINNANGDLIAFLDCDDKWLSQKLEKQIPLFNQNIGLVYSNVLIYDEKINKYSDYFEDKKPYKGNVLNELFFETFIPILSVVIKKNIIDKIGGFSDELLIVEDLDLWLRFAENYPVDYVDECLAIYRTHDNNLHRVKKHIFVDEYIQVLETCINRNKNSLKKKDIAKKMSILFFEKGRILLTEKIFYQSIYFFLKSIKLYPQNILKLFIRPIKYIYRISRDLFFQQKVLH
jgi:glycosyltransferase involved in cell wall biosynthesis